MKKLSSLFRSKPPADDFEPSVLDGWKAYSAPETSSNDVEDGTGGLFSATSLKENTTTLVGNLTRAASGLSTASVTKTLSGGFAWPSTTTMYQAAAVGAVGIFFLVLAFTVALPVIVVFPSKFALCFTIGCALIMTSFAMLTGWKQQMEHMMTASRLPFTVGYLGSMGLTLHAALFQKSYVLSLCFSGLQVLALLYYVFSYLPGGAMGVQIVTNIVSRSCFICLGGARRMIFK